MGLVMVYINFTVFSGGLYKDRYGLSFPAETLAYPGMDVFSCDEMDPSPFRCCCPSQSLPLSMRREEVVAGTDCCSGSAIAHPTITHAAIPQAAAIITPARYVFSRRTNW